MNSNEYFSKSPNSSKQVLSVLLLEDHHPDAVLLQKFLMEPISSDHSFSIKAVARLSEGLAEIANQRFDLILLDLSLPDTQGLATLKAVQEKCGAIPVVVFTGNTDEKLGVEAVRLGAQDYLLKGQTPPDVLCRSLLFAIERSASPQPEASDLIVEMKNFKIDFQKQQIFSCDKMATSREFTPLALTPLEFKIFVFLFQEKNQVVSRGRVVAEVWGTANAEEISVRSVDRHISALKRKTSSLDLSIETSYGVGYKLCF
jgi:DNA-binding response OmpR family regulator